MIFRILKYTSGIGLIQNYMSLGNLFAGNCIIQIIVKLLFYENIFLVKNDLKGYDRSRETWIDTMQ